MTNDSDIIMYTDGGCHNNGDRKGDGSYAFLMKTDNKEYVDVICEYIKGTTNNRMEMMGAIEGLKYAHSNRISNISVVSDSGYLVKGYTDPAYLERWMTSGWKTSTNKPVQNVDMWQELMKISWHIGFNFEHIRGHNKDGNKTHAFWNDICDKACTYMINKFMVPGFVLTLRYYFKSKEFKQVSIKLVERDNKPGGNNYEQ